MCHPPDLPHSPNFRSGPCISPKAKPNLTKLTRERPLSSRGIRCLALSSAVLIDCVHDGQSLGRERRRLVGRRLAVHLLALLGGVLSRRCQRLPRPRRHAPYVITGCTCAQRTRHDERDAPPTRRGKDLFVCAGRAPHIAPPRGRRVGTIGTGANLRARRRRPAASTCAPLQKVACAAGTAGASGSGRRLLAGPCSFIILEKSILRESSCLQACLQSSAGEVSWRYVAQSPRLVRF